jgi:RNA-splicing ligase RtcB
MKIISGKYNTAVVFSDNIEGTAAQQILELCNQEFVSGSRIRIMPDAHAGAGCAIGTTMTIKDKVVPNLVGVDIGCGMFVSRLQVAAIDCAKLDQVIRSAVPSGFAIRRTPHEYSGQVALGSLRCREHVDLERAWLSIGTLGGGNHFIEVDRDDDGNLYLVVHSGSRHLGKQIAERYQRLAGREVTGINRALAYLEGGAFADYIHDMRIAQKYAACNRQAIAAVIVASMGWTVTDSFTTTHNYIDLDNMVLRKGAISAQQGEVVIIPVNMRDGSILATGRGNDDWNRSAPHGAGRLMSRSQARRELSLDDFRRAMAGVFTTSVSRQTLDEAPSAYKPMAELIANMQATVRIDKIIKPVYNFKAPGD